MGKHILIAEDDEDDLVIFKEAAEQTGLPIIISHVTYCEGVFDYADKNVMPDVLVLDGILPGKSLLECISDVRRDERWKEVPLVVLSGSNHKTVINNCYVNGINLYLEKRNSFNDVMDLVTRLFYHDWRLTPVLTSEDFYKAKI